MAYKKKRTFPKREGVFLKEFMKELDKTTKNLWYFKSHGEPMQVRGLPDVMCCYRGFFLAIEFKIMRAGNIKVSPYQEHVLEKIGDALGLKFVIWYDEAQADVGIGKKRFDDKKEAVEYLVKAMDFHIFNTLSQH